MRTLKTLAVCAIIGATGGFFAGIGIDLVGYLLQP